MKPLVVIVVLCIIIFTLIVLAIVEHLTIIDKNCQIQDLRKYNRAMKVRFDKLYRRQNAIKYTNEVIEFIRDTATQVCILKFKSFQDGHDMDKLVEGNIKTLISDTANDIRVSINMDLFDYNKIIYTRSYLEKYIVESTIYQIKTLLEQNEI